MAPPPPLPEDLRNAEHIRLLVIFHYVMAVLGFAVLMGLLLHFMVMRTVFSVVKDLPQPIETVTGQKVEVQPAGPNPELQVNREDQGRKVDGKLEIESEVFKKLPKSFEVFLYFYLGVGVLIFLVVILNFLSARAMAQRKNKAFSIVVAAINCLNVPLGTILGVFTIVILSRASVEESYQRRIF